MEISDKKSIRHGLSIQMPLSSEVKQEVLNSNGVAAKAAQKLEDESNPVEVTDAVESNEETQYLEGLQLYVLVVGLTLVGFLVALNASVVVTVSTFVFTRL